MKYDEISHDEAMRELEQHPDTVEMDDRLRKEIISAPDVLCWLDAFGDFSLAINCQGLPKDLPTGVIRAINEYDVFNDWNGSITESSCPICGVDFYEFDFDAIYPVIDKHGHNHEYIEHVSDPAGYYWNAVGDEHLMCQHCRDPPNFSRMAPEPTTNEIRIFYGETDEFSRFSHQGGVVRWDFEWDMDYEKSTDLYNLHDYSGDRVEGTDIAKAFAGGYPSRGEMMDRLGFRRIHIKKIEQNVKGIRRFWRYAKEVLTGWAKLDSKTMTEEPTHPDLNFTYIIEGEYQAWISVEHYEKFKAELVWQSLREANDFTKAKEYGKSNEDILLNQYYETAQ